MVWGRKAGKGGPVRTNGALWTWRLAGGNPFGQEFMEKNALGTEPLLVLPGVELDAFTYVSGQQPTQVALLCFVDQASLPFLASTLNGGPAGVVLEVSSVAVSHQKEERSSFHRSAGVSPPLFTALHRPKRYAQEIRKVGLGETDLLPGSSQIQVGSSSHGGSPIGPLVPPPFRTALTITL
jgi:hypothetical protein